MRKVDAWSVGATVWEMVESEPPFIEIEDPREIPDKWPALSQPELYSRSLHDFIRFCSSPPATRPNAKDLLMVRGYALCTPWLLVLIGCLRLFSSFSFSSFRLHSFVARHRALSLFSC